MNPQASRIFHDLAQQAARLRDVGAETELREALWRHLEFPKQRRGRRAVA